METVKQVILVLVIFRYLEWKSMKLSRVQWEHPRWNRECDPLQKRLGRMCYLWVGIDVARLVCNTYSLSLEDRWVSIYYLDIWNMNIKQPSASAYSGEMCCY